MNLSLQHSIIDSITMMLNTKTFVPRTLQLKLHIEAQISSGVLVLREHFSQVERSSCGDDSIYFAAQIIEEFFRGNKRHGILPHCS